MFFQISPVPKNKVTVPKKVTNESEEVTVLSLAPFTSNPKLFFENVKVGDVCNRKLLIKNPNTFSVELHISNNFPDDFNVNISWDKYILQPDAEVTLELTWCPSSEGSWRYILNVEGNKRIHKDVPVAFKTVSTKQRKCDLKLKKPSYLSKKNKAPIRKSPGRKSTVRRISPVKKQSVQFHPQTLLTTPKGGIYNITNKENVDKANSPVFISPSQASFNYGIVTTVERRETYTLKCEKLNTPVLSSSNFYNINSENVNARRETYTVKSQKPDISVSDSNSEFTDSLEMMSPDSVTSKNVPDRINDPKTATSISTNILSKLQSTSFAFSPLTTPHKKIDQFLPSACSSGEKSYNLTSSYLSDGISPTTLFANKNSTFGLERRSYSPKLLNVSSETYVKGNVSSETFTKMNTTGGTYVKDCSVGDLTSLATSPVLLKDSQAFDISPCYRNQPVSVSQSYVNVQESPSHLKNLGSENVRSIIEASQWSNCNRKLLGSIKEESYSRTSGCESEKETPHKRSIKRRSDITLHCVSPKRPYLEDKNHLSKQNWSKKLVLLRKPKKTTGLNLQQFVRKTENGEQKETVISVTDTHQVVVNDTQQVFVKNPYILAATNMVDPFMTSSLYFDEEWVEEQENNFKKWLNALLTPPEELNSNIEGPAIDVAKVWQQCKKTEVAEAPSKEVISSKYHTNARLNSLRKAAQALFMSPEITVVLTKVISAVESEKLVIRKDRNIHLDLGLQSGIMSLLLSYNPLWLRIGLETICNQIIPLNSNSDVIGLSTFIMGRFFKDPYLLRKYKSIHSPKYIVELKKFLLKKFFILVYFLDQAKLRKLITHDPCLFCKNAPVKESREILICFARDTLAAIGDVTKYLKLLGYVVEHKQTYIHEFDYAVKCLGGDLRDGVRLTKVMEIILLEDGLTNKLRVPAISRLQKVHNTKLVFDSLEKAGFKIMHDITPKDIVDGHKEKTLSFLWQIIYKFQAPLMVKSVTTIQTWWRSLRITVKRNHLRKIRARKEAAASKIQQWYRRQKLSIKMRLLRDWLIQYLEEKRLENAAVKIQSYLRMYLCRKNYRLLKSTIINIQAYSRKWLFINHYKKRIVAAVKIQSFARMYLAKSRYLKVKHSVLTIQNWYRACIKMREEREYYEKLKYSVLYLQSLFKANLLMKKHHSEYIALRNATIMMQRRFRANKVMKFQIEEYMKIRSSTMMIQNWYRATKLMRKYRSDYLNLKKAVNLIEARYLANKYMKCEKAKYLRIKCATIKIQHTFRAYKEMKTHRQYFLNLKQTVTFVQRKLRANKLCANTSSQYNNLKKYVIICQRQFRANQAMKRERSRFIRIRESTLTIQKYYKAYQLMKTISKQYVVLKESTVKIQTYFRAYIAMKNQRNGYALLRKTTIRIQELYRAKLKMREAKQDYLKTKNATLVIQRYFRAYLLMKKERDYFRKLKGSTVVIQQRYRAQRKMTLERNNYIKLKEATLTLQRHFRARILMKQQHQNYIHLRTATVKIQQRYRAFKKMQAEINRYKQIRNAAITIQQRFRAQRLLREQIISYQNLRKAIIYIQTKFKAKLQMKLYKEHYCKLRQTVITVQRRFRANCLMRQQRQQYLLLKQSTIKIQERYRARNYMKIAMHNYKQTRHATIVLQRRFRAKLQMQKDRTAYLTLKKQVLFIQTKYRSKLRGKLVFERFQAIKKSTLVIQRRYRANYLMKLHYHHYRQLKIVAIFTQRKFRANQAMKQTRGYYELIKKSVVIIQSRFRAYQLLKKDKEYYCRLRRVTLFIQRRFRANRERKIHQNNYLMLKTATIVIQRKFRATLKMRVARKRYLALLTSVKYIQNRFRANKKMETTRNGYVVLQHAIKVIQRRLRATLLTKRQREYYLLLRKSVIFVQQKYTAKLSMKRERRKYVELKHACIVIQSRFRALKISREQRNYYQKLKKYTLLIQNLYRAKLNMKKSQTEYTLLKRSTILIQQNFRAYIQMKKDMRYYKNLKHYTIFIQNKFRAKILSRKERAHYLKVRKAVTIIQQRYIEYRSSCRIRNNYLTLKQAAVTIQRRYKAHLAMKKCREDFMLLKKSAICIQRHYRALILMKQCKREHELKKRSIICIQRWWRTIKHTRLTRKQFLVIKHSAITIQQFYRRYSIYKSDFKHFTNLKRAAILIQSKYRALILMRNDRKRFVQLRSSAIIIQQYFRSYLSMKKEHSQYMQKKSVILGLQRYARGFLVRRKYAHLLTEEAKQKRKELQIKNKAATKIQALWKGHRTRSEEKPEFVQIRQRSRDAHIKAVPENTLGYRSKQAVQLLVTDNITLFQIIRALEDLEYVTRRCRVTCIQLSKILPEQLYMMISLTSRSLPEMNACNLATHILINFCKYSETSRFSWVPQYMDNVVTVMLHWCDKESLLFPSLCTLLWLFAHIQEYKTVIRSIPNYEQRICKIENLCIRKNKMVQRAGIKGFSVFGPHGNLPLPSLSPDWGLDYKDKPKTFTNSIHALKSLLNQLQ